MMEHELGPFGRADLHPRRSVLPLKHALTLRWCEDQSDLLLVRRGSG